MVQKEEMRSDLLLSFGQLKVKYPWLEIRYEFSSDWDTYLVSYRPMDKVYEDGELVQQIEKLEDELISKYGDDAPLFCEGDRLFVLSDAAEVIPGLRGGCDDPVLLHSCDGLVQRLQWTDDGRPGYSFSPTPQYLAYSVPREGSNYANAA